MRSICSLVRSDLSRLAHSFLALVVMAGIMCIPGLYAWVTILGFWDPYANTSAIRIAVVNEDAGYESERLGAVNIGQQVSDNLASNDQLDWEFMSREEAMDSLQSSRSYAAIIMGSTLSEQLVKAMQGEGQQPALEYYVNEKINPIAPRITDSGATTIDRSINSAFVGAVSDAVSRTIDQVAGDIDSYAAASTTRMINNLRTTRSTIATIRESINETTQLLGRLSTHIQSAKNLLNQAHQLRESLSNTMSELNKQQTALMDSLHEAMSVSKQPWTQGTSALTDLAKRAADTIEVLSDTISHASASMQHPLTTLSRLNDRFGQMLADLDELGLADNAPASHVIDQVRGEQESITTLLEHLQTLADQAHTDAGDTADAASQALTTLNTTISTLQKTYDSLVANPLYSLKSNLSQVHYLLNSLTQQVNEHDSLYTLANTVLDSIEETQQNTASALRQVNETLGTLETTLSTMSADMSALADSNTLHDWVTNGGLNANSIASFMASPTILTTNTVFPITSYGSGMAPLFTSLALWVGSFVLMVMMRLQVSNKTGEQASARAQYWARWLLFVLFATLQGLICAIGDLIIGVQCASIPAFMLTCMLISLCYVSVMYAICATFHHVGKALCVALLIVQIPGSAGLYPIEMMPTFFRAINPLLPFTYAISALRETIGGFYQYTWLASMTVLIIVAAAAHMLGLLLQPRLVRLQRLFARQIENSDLFVGEGDNQDTTTTINTSGFFTRTMHLIQLYQALTDRQRYQQLVHQRTHEFTKRYYHLRHCAFVLGIIVPIMLAITCSLSNGAKLFAIAYWVIWLLIYVAFMLGIELYRDALTTSRHIALLPREELLGAIRWLEGNTQEASEAQETRQSQRNQQRHVVQQQAQIIQDSQGSQKQLREYRQQEAHQEVSCRQRAHEHETNQQGDHQQETQATLNTPGPSREMQS